MTRVAYLVKTLKAYRVPLFSLMQKLEGVESLFCFDAEPDAYEQAMLKTTPLKYSVFTSVRISWLPFVQKRFARTLPLDMWRRLTLFNPDVVFAPEYSLETLIAALYCALKHSKLVIWCSLTEYDERISFKGQRLLRKVLRRRANAFVHYSQLAKEFLVENTVPAEQCFHVENCTDVDFFLKAYHEKDDSRPSTRLLYVGALIREKGLLDLFDALRGLLQYDWSLTIVGEGILREELEGIASQKLSGRVKFLGKKARHELPAIYHEATVFVFPSHSDVWGHVVDEAMASGCCVLASDRSIAAVELIQHGYNGFLIEAHNVEMLHRQLREIVSDRSLQSSMGKTAHMTMGKHNEFHSLEGIREAIAYVVRT